MSILIKNIQKLSMNIKSGEFDNFDGIFLLAFPSQQKFLFIANFFLIYILPDPVERSRTNRTISAAPLDLDFKVFFQFLLCHHRSVDLVEFKLEIGRF
jgi:hypothetical protein